jgi:hypothetical protein
MDGFQRELLFDFPSTPLRQGVFLCDSEDSGTFIDVCETRVAGSAKILILDDVIDTT